MNELKLNIKIEGLKELTAAINLLAGAPAAMQSVEPVQGNQPGQCAPGMNPMQYQSAAPVAPPQPIGQVGAMPGQVLPQPTGQVPTQPTGQVGAMPGQVPAIPTVQGAVPAQVPTTANVQGYTIEQLQVAAAGLMSAGKGAQVMGILQQFGIQAMTELPQERYGEFATVLREAGAQI